LPGREGPGFSRGGGLEKDDYMEIAEEGSGNENEKKVDAPPCVNNISFPPGPGGVFWRGEEDQKSTGGEKRGCPIKCRELGGGAGEPVSLGGTNKYEEKSRSGRSKGK